MTLFNGALVVLAVTVSSVSTDAHVAPSVDDNNRYLKVTPLRGGFRLAYTVFFGEIPGASERRLLDSNRDGRIDEAEAKRFGDKLAGQIAASLELDLGGKAQRVEWTVVDVGLGNRAVAAGSFSVDMIGYFCAPGRMKLKDQFRIPRPGETEVLVEDGPGVTVDVARIGALADPRRDWRFLGAGGPLSDEGLSVQWTAADSAPALPNGASCTTTAQTGGSGSSRVPFVFGALVVVCAAVAGVLVGRRARRRRPG